MTHYHICVDGKPAHAILPKVNMDNPPIFPGYVGVCECGKPVFFFHDKSLRPVEVEEKPIA